MSDRDDAAMVAWVRDWISRERSVKPKRSVRAIGADIGVSHSYLLSLEKGQRKRLAAGVEQGVADRFFGGSKDAFRAAAIDKFPGAHLAVVPQIKGQTRFIATPYAAAEATRILVGERDVNDAASVAAVVPFTFFANEEDASNVVLVTNALHEAVKGPGAASRAGDRASDLDPQASRRR